MASPTDPPSAKVFFAGDLCNKFEHLYPVINKQQSKRGKFNALFTCGKTLATSVPGLASGLSSLPEAPLPIPTYFIEKSDAELIQNHAWGKNFYAKGGNLKGGNQNGASQKAGEGENDGGDGDGVGENSNDGADSDGSEEDDIFADETKARFLGSHGVFTCPNSGLRVAFLSGHYRKEVYEAPDESGGEADEKKNGEDEGNGEGGADGSADGSGDADDSGDGPGDGDGDAASSDPNPSFVGACYKRRAILEILEASKESDEDLQDTDEDAVRNRGVDVLLCSEWPEGWDRKLFSEADLPAKEQIERIKKQAGSSDNSMTTSKGKDGSATTSKYREPNQSPAIAELCGLLEPKYVVCASGTADCYYQRKPYESLKTQQLTKMISLGRVKDMKEMKKHNIFLHALTFVPVCRMSDRDFALTGAEARANAGVDGITAFPFAESAQKRKRQREEEAERDMWETDPTDPTGKAKRRRLIPLSGDGNSGNPALAGGFQLFLTNLANNLTGGHLMKAFGNAVGGRDKILKIHVPMKDGNSGNSENYNNEHGGKGGAKGKGKDGGENKGFGFLTLKTEEAARKALELNEMMECGGRKIKIEVAKSSTNRNASGDGEDGGGEGANSAGNNTGNNPGNNVRVIKNRIVVEPHADCWFCLANPKVEKHMLISSSEQVYLALAKGGLTKEHCLLLPVKHVPNFMSAINFDNCEQFMGLLKKYIEALRVLFREREHDIVVYERWIPFRKAEMNHMQLQIIPVPQSEFIDWKRALGQWQRETGLSFEPLKSMEELIATNASKFSDSDTEKNLEIIGQLPYLYLELPGTRTAKGTNTMRFVAYGSTGKPGTPGVLSPNMPREFVVKAMQMDKEKADWRNCQIAAGEEKAAAIEMRRHVKGVAHLLK